MIASACGLARSVGTRTPSLLTRRYQRRRPDPFRTVRDLGLVFPGCPGGSGRSEGCLSVWLPAWLPAARHAGTNQWFSRASVVHGPSSLLPALLALEAGSSSRSSRVYPAHWLCPLNPRIKSQARPCCKSSKSVRSLGLAWVFALTSIHRDPAPSNVVAARVAALRPPTRRRAPQPFRAELAAMLGVGRCPSSRRVRAVAHACCCQGRCCIRLPNRDCLYLAGDGPRPVRAGSGLALVL